LLCGRGYVEILALCPLCADSKESILLTIMQAEDECVCYCAEVRIAVTILKEEFRVLEENIRQ
jgi:hypothetical protein